jgi:carbamoyl-phosphate synthase large subunit
VFVSVRDPDKERILPVARKFRAMGFHLVATRGTARCLQSQGIAAEVVLKISEGRPHVVDHIKNAAIHLVINTSSGKRTHSDSYYIRRATLVYNVPYSTTIAEALAIADAVEKLQQGDWQVKTIQEYHAEGSRGLSYP